MDKNKICLELSFIVVGPQKTATTWLFEKLSPLPNLSTTIRKEIFFWDRYFERGFKWYEQQFNTNNSNVSHDVIYCEFAPSLFESKEALDRLKKCHPHLKIVITLRDPIERQYSLYLHHRRAGRLYGGFEEEFTESNLLGSMYKDYLPKWIDAFSDQNVKVFLYEDLINDFENSFPRLLEFIGQNNVDLSSVRHQQRVNNASHPKSLFLASCATKVSSLFRDLKLELVIDLAKKLGLKTIFKGGKEPDTISPEFKGYLSEYYEEDYKYVSNLLKRTHLPWTKHVNNTKIG